jgi:hypothetical protein
MTQKIVINTCYGGFSLSDTAEELYCAYAGTNVDNLYARGIARNDPILLQVIHQLGEKACSGRHADLAVVEIPDDVEWTIEEYDGKEWVAEVHRTWS